MVTTHPLLKVSILSSNFNLKKQSTSAKTYQPIIKNFY